MLYLILVLFPALCGVAVPLLPRREALYRRMLYAACGVTLLLCVLAVCLPEKPLSLPFSEALSFSLSADGISSLFVCLVSGGFFLTALYSGFYMPREGGERRFAIWFLLSESMLLGCSLASDLTTLYLFYELLTFCSMPLVLHSFSRASITAAQKYLFYSVAGAFLALFGMFVFYAETGTLAFTGFEEAGSVPESGRVALSLQLIGIGFGAKAGLFPLHGWLPSAHPVAPAPASALLSGLIAKAGVLALLRTFCYLPGIPQALTHLYPRTVLLILACLTVLIGSAMACREKVLKRRLAYSTVSQISYALLGIFLLTPDGVSGALFQVCVHAAAKMLLFLGAGAIICCTGCTRVDQLTGMGRRMPVTFACMTVASLSLVGLPPFGGFYAKWTIAKAALAGAPGVLAYIIPAVLLVSALLTAAYLLPMMIQAFFPAHDAVPGSRIREPLLLAAPLAVLSVCLLSGDLTPLLMRLVTGQL